MTESARAAREIGNALSEGRRKTERNQSPARLTGVLGLQRLAGNAAVNALLAAKGKSPGEAAAGHIDSALNELRGSDPAISTVEAGLKAAEAAGVPVQLEGPKPPASALAVTMTGFGPEAVAPPRSKPAPKPVPTVNALGKTAAKAGSGAPSTSKPSGPAPPAATAAPPSPMVTSQPAALSADQLALPPVPPKATTPEQDPAFSRVAGGVKTVGAVERAHPAAGSQAEQAQNAALAPSDDAAGQAKAAKVDTMDAQQAGSFDKKSFIAAVKAAIEAKSPKTLKEADHYAESGKAKEVKDGVKGIVTQGKQGQAKDIEAATGAEPDTSKAVPKPVTPLTPDVQGPAPGVAGDGAAPKPAPPEQVNLEAGKQQANQEMADAQVSDEQLAQSNEPQFQKALTDKQEAAAHADTAPGEFRKQEQAIIADGKAQAAAETQAGIAAMHGSKAGALGKLTADKGKAKSKDETKRAEVTARVQSIYSGTETEVKKILEGIDPDVEKAFDEGEASARKNFEAFVAQKMSAYKADRYSGWLGGLRWAKDELVGMPDAVNRFYEAGRELYLKQMDDVITRVANVVGDGLGAAKRRIAAGKSEIASYVSTLPANLKAVGADAAKEIGDKFEQLESDVNDKQQSVVDTLATKYVESRKGLDERIEALQAENKGLVDKAIDGIKGVINTIRQLAAMLMNTLARVASVVGDIIKHPVKFLGNLVAGVKGGILKFKDNILDHLRKGLMGWLFGALAEGGVQVPDKFDLQGIVKLLLSLFGLTWTNIRNRIVKQIGEKAMGAVEKGVDIFQKIAGGGVAALWQMLIEKLGDIKEMIMSQVKDFVVTKIITAGITWLIGLLNPAAAFIKACKLIYDVIMFFVTNGERIMKFVNTVIDSAADILGGNIGGVVSKIENVLGQMVPILIGFLASVIGIGGIGQKIREILEKLQKPFNKAIDFVIKTGLKIAGPIIRAVKGIGGKIKAGVAKGKAYVKAGVAKVKGKAKAGVKKIRDWAAAIPGAFAFRGGGKSHRVWIEKSGARRIMVASTPTDANALLAYYAGVVNRLPDLAPKALRGLKSNADLRERLARATQTQQQLKLAVEAVTTAGDPSVSRANLTNKQHNFALDLKDLFDDVHQRQVRAAGKAGKYPSPAKGGMTKGTVVCSAVFTVVSDAGQRPYPTSGGGHGPVGTEPAEKRQGVGRRHGFGREDSSLTGLFGGFAFEGEQAKGQTEQRAEFVTRSTGDATPSTHAEARLLTQIERMLATDPGWKARVRTIEIHLSHSPCPGCTGRLLALRQKLDNGNIRLAIVQWTNVYKHPQWPTTPDDIRDLRGKYTALGPFPA